jgi:hypothetical protein
MSVFKNRSVKLLKPYWLLKGALILHCDTGEIKVNGNALIFGDDYIFTEGPGDEYTRIYHQNNTLLHSFKIDI